MDERQQASVGPLAGESRWDSDCPRGGLQLRSPGLFFARSKVGRIPRCRVRRYEHLHTKLPCQPHSPVSPKEAPRTLAGAAVGKVQRNRLRLPVRRSPVAPQVPACLSVVSCDWAASSIGLTPRCRHLSIQRGGSLRTGLKNLFMSTCLRRTPVCRGPHSGTTAAPPAASCTSAACSSGT